MGAAGQIISQSSSWKLKEGVGSQSGRECMHHLIPGCDYGINDSRQVLRAGRIPV